MNSNEEQQNLDRELFPKLSSDDERTVGEGSFNLGQQEIPSQNPFIQRRLPLALQPNRNVDSQINAQDDEESYFQEYDTLEEETDSAENDQVENLQHHNYCLGDLNPDSFPRATQFLEFEENQRLNQQALQDEIDEKFPGYITAKIFLRANEQRDSYSHEFIPVQSRNNIILCARIRAEFLEKQDIIPAKMIENLGNFDLRVRKISCPKRILKVLAFKRRGWILVEGQRRNEIIARLDDFEENDQRIMIPNQKQTVLARLLRKDIHDVVESPVEAAWDTLYINNNAQEYFNSLDNRQDLEEGVVGGLCILRMRDEPVDGPVPEPVDDPVPEPEFIHLVIIRREIQLGIQQDE